MTMTNTNIPVPADVENALLDLDGIGAILNDMAAAIEGGCLIEPRSLCFLSNCINDRIRTLADDLGMKIFPADEEG